MTLCEIRADQEHYGLMSQPENIAAQREAYTPHVSVHQMVTMQASLHPHRPAVLCGREQLSYSEMNRRANLLARYLRAHGVGRESIVALWLRRSPWIMVAALAALKAQAAYLPLDPEHPAERLLFTVRDSGAKVVLTESALAEATQGARCPVVVLDSICDEVMRYGPEDLELESSPNDLAYLIYTSGSTGTPKGVEISHANLANLIAWHNRAFGVTAEDRASHLAGLGFDASVWEMWPYLTVGASLCLADYHTLIDAERLRDWIVDSEISIGFVPTPVAERLLTLDWPMETKLRTLLTGGDTLHRYPPARLPFSVVNNYGPTECTVVATSCVVPKTAASSLPAIGVPIDNTEVHILNARLEPCPCGKPGEIYIGGANVGRGYRNRPDLTAQRFVSNPFSPNERLFKTGDMGYFLPDGQIAFLGRTDNQVKIRGYRIELEEIAAVLNSHPKVTASTVALHGVDGAEKQLVAYLVAQQKPSVRDLQNHLSTRLPDYMVPSIFVRLEGLPLTANGKVDRSALPEPTAENMLVEAALAPSSDIEIRLALLLAGLLKVPEIGVDDDFFMLGGHSLLGTQLIARIRESFQVEMPLLALFDRPTVRGLAAEIERLLRVGEDTNPASKAQELQRPIPPPQIVRRPGDQPACLSIGQEAMWRHMRLSPELTCYNEPVTVYRTGPLDISVLQSALTELVRRHEAWRTNFATVAGEPVQLIRKAPDAVEFPIDDLRPLPAGAREAEALRLASQDASTPFDLERNPLFRARLVRLGDEDYRLFITAHHIILDGVTVFDILYPELVACYNALLAGEAPRLPEIPVQFADFAYWQRQHMHDEKIARQLAYWREQLADPAAPVQLPTDFPRQPERTYRGAIHSFAFTKALTEELRSFSEQHGMSMFVVMVAAYIALLHRYTLQRDVTIGTVAPGARKEPQLQHVMGLMQTRVPLRVDLSGDPTIRELLLRVRAVVSEALSQDDVPFEVLAGELKPKRDPSRGVFFDTMFSLQPRVPETGPGWNFTTMDAQPGGARHDLFVEMDDRTAGMRGHAQYNTDLFTEQTIARLAKDFEATLAVLMANPEQTLSDLSPLTLIHRAACLSAKNEAA